MGREQLAEAEEHSKTVERKAQEAFEMLKVDSMQTPLPASLNILSAIQDAEAARKQIAYLGDWRIKDSDFVLVSKIAAGGEGEVWRGILHGKFDVAIKLTFNFAVGKDQAGSGVKVWDEREAILPLSCVLARSSAACLD